MAARPSATTQATGDEPVRMGCRRGVTVSSVAGMAGSGRCSSGQVPGMRNRWWYRSFGRQM